MGTSSSAFAPDWASPPGETVRDVMVDRGITAAEIAQAIELPLPDVERVLVGELEITLGIAQGLAKYVGATTQFWVNRECQYRDGLARGGLDLWARSLPTKEMTRLGWLPEIRSPDDLAQAWLDFFQVPDLRAWTATRSVQEATRYRSSRSFGLNDGAAVVWLQQARRQASKIPSVARWNSEKFAATLVQLRRLTQMKDPQVFVPQIRAALARVGVRFVVVKALSGCTVSGASQFLQDGSALIALTARHLTDDQLWFTLFHEAGHLLMHDRAEIFLDDLDKTSAEEGEREADDFAARSLVPQELLAELPTHRSPNSREIIRAAVRHGVAAGVVVGQLQHRRVLGFESLNSLKRRYRWNGSNLEKA